MLFIWVKPGSPAVKANIYGYKKDKIAENNRNSRMSCHLVLPIFYKRIMNEQLEYIILNLLFRRDVALTYGGAVHFSHFDITLNLSEV